MSTEKIIRSQAKKSLNGNWTAAVSGLFVLLAEVLLVAVFYSMLTGLTGIYEGEKLKSGSEPIVIIILVLTIIFAFALSPFENGFYRLHLGHGVVVAHGGLGQGAEHVQPRHGLGGRLVPLIMRAEDYIVARRIVFLGTLPRTLA